MDKAAPIDNEGAALFAAIERAFMATRCRQPDRSHTTLRV